MEATPELDGQIAIITGAGRGIGAAAARALAAAGAVTVLTARSKHELDEVADGIRHAGGQAEVVIGDLADLQFIDELFDEVDRRCGRLDILVNNAGAFLAGPMEEVPATALQEMLNVNTIAPYACMLRAVQMMRAGSDDGRIVNVGSSQVHWQLSGASGPYAATKSALRALTLGVSKQLKEAGSGTRVCMVNPGVTDTTMVNPSGDSHPFLLDPEHVARSILYAVVAPPEVHVIDTVVVAQPWSPW